MGTDYEDILLGFMEKVESWTLNSKFFPSKVGGRPAWLVLNDLPDVTCSLCEKPLSFLCQIYSPIYTKSNCFHRTLFVFVCINGVCNSENDASNVKVFRSQLPRDNKFYSFMAIDPVPTEKENAEKPTAADYVKLCYVCGKRGPKACGSCFSINYCSREHQALDWKLNHKKACNNSELMKSLKAFSGKPLFEEMEIDCDPEEEELKEVISESEIMEEYEALLRKGQNGQELGEDSVPDPEAESDIIKMAAKDTDKAFTKFRLRILDNPNQILRYHLGGEPLYVSTNNIPSSIPNCKHCGSKRHFEFQIMPQLLVHLLQDSTGSSLDWGTLLVYSCEKSCTTTNGYVEEVVYKQDYTPDVEFLKQT